MAFSRILRKSHTHKKDASIDAHSNHRSDSPYGNTDPTNSRQNSSHSHHAHTPTTTYRHDNHSNPASLPKSSSSGSQTTGWYDEAAASQKAEDALRAESRGEVAGERPQLRFPDKLNADAAARLHTAYSQLIDRMESQGRMKFNTKPKSSGSGTGSANVSGMRRSTVDSTGCYSGRARSSSRLVTPGSQPSSSSSRRDYFTRVREEPSESIDAVYPALEGPEPFYDDPDLPVDPYGDTDVLPPREETPIDPYTFDDFDSVVQTPVRSRGSSESSTHASRTRNVLGLRVNTERTGSSRRYRKTSNGGHEDEETPSLVVDEGRGESDEVTPVCESLCSLDIGNSPTIRKMDESPVSRRSRKNDRATTSYKPDEIMQMVKQALMHTQAQNGISVEAIEDAIMREMSSRRQAGTESEDPVDDDGCYASSRSQSRATFSSGRYSPDPIALPPPSREASEICAYMHKTMQNIAEREIARRQQLCEEEYYDEDEEGDSTASPVLDEREQCGPDFDAPRSRLAEPIVWSSPKYPRKTLPVRTKSLSHRHRQRQNPRHYDAHYYQEDDTPDPYAEFEMPLEMLVPDADSYVAKPLPPVPTRQFRSKTNPLAGVDLEGQSRSRAATVRFQSALEKPGKPYNSSPFAVGANHDRTAVGRRRMPAQSLGIPEEYDD